MLVHYPHYLTGVHSGAAAHRDDAVGLKCVHCGGTLFRASERGIGSDVEERGVGYTHFVEFVGYRFGVTVIVKEAVGDDERFLLAHYVLELVKSHREASFLDVNFLRCSEPQHIFSPFRYCLDIDKVFDADVFADAVAAPGTASERKGRREFEVIYIADTALRRRSVDEHAAGLHPRVELLQFFLLGKTVDIYRRSMTEAAVRDKSFGFVERFVKALGAIHGEHGGELLVSEFFADVDGFHFADEHFRCFGNGNARERRDLISGLPYYFRVQSAVDDYGLAHLFGFVGLEEISSARGEFLFDGIVNFVEHDDGLLGSAYHTVIESLTVDNGVDGKQNIRGIVDYCGSIARAHAHCGFTG